MMKAILKCAVLCSVLFLGSCSGSGNYADGVYAGEAVGNGGKLKIEVTIKSGKVNSIALLDNSETPEMVAAVEGSLLPRIIDQQSTENVDTVSGATNTSKAVLSAVSKILAENPRK